MPPITRTNRFAWAAAVGLAIGIAYTASPLTCWVLAAVPILLHLAGRGLPEPERRALVGILVAAIALRAVVLGAVLVSGIPWHNDLAVGALAGDEAYNLSRALRARDMLLGFATTRYDFFVVFDDYGASSYIDLLAGLQMLFGPTPYSVRLLNAVAFVGGAVLLYRLARTSFGTVPALTGLVVLLLLPSLFHASISLLKESAYFLASAVLISAVVWALRATCLRNAGMAVVAMGASLWMLGDLRRGTALLAVAGIGAGLAFRVLASGRRTAVAAAVAAGLGLVALAAVPSVQQPVIRGVEAAARLHSGHVFTVGHAYKLLDPGFYANPATPSASRITLTPPQALRFAVRSAVSFVVTPLPWELRSARQLAFLPEHLVWYVLVALLPVGLVAGWRRDPLVTCVLAGYALAMAAVVATTTGNVGTLLRLRGLVTPYILWMSALGLCVLVETVAARRRRPDDVTTSHARPAWENA